MISTTFAGQAVYLVNNAPNWGGRINATFEVVSQIEEGLSNRETRRQHADTIRTRLKQKVTVEGAEALSFAAFLRSYQAEAVATPLWPAAVTWGNRASAGISGGLKVAFKADWSTWELYTSVEPGWVLSTDYVAPVIWGRLESRKAVWITPQACEFELDLVESGPASYALAPAASSFTAGPSLAGYATAPKVYPLPLDWADVPESFSVRILREQIGFGRQPIETLYPQTNTREASFRTIVSSDSNAGKILRFFLDHAGGKAFWSPTWRSAAIMAADLAYGATALSVTSTAGVLAGDYLAFVNGNGVTNWARISTLAGNTINLAAAPGAFSASDTVVAPLILARMEKPRLEVSWLDLGVAEATFSVVELPPEYSPAADETLGTTIGLLSTRCYLYEIAQTIGGTTTTTRLTSYEQNVTLSGNTYTARKIDHGGIRNSLFIDRNEVDLRSEVVAGDVLVKLATAQSEAPARLTILSADVSGTTASNSAVLFTGDLTGLSVRGSRLTAKAVTAGTVFDRLYPRFRLQVGCNHSLFSTGCGLSSANWKFTATIASPLVAGYPFAINLSGLARVIGVVPTIGSGWFSGGWIEFGSGSSLVRRAILNSTAVVSGAFQVTLARDPSPFPSVGNTVALYPGCDGSKDTCTNKFANFVNFGGHPFLPASNPSMVKMSQNLGGGKK